MMIEELEMVTEVGMLNATRNTSVEIFKTNSKCTTFTAMHTKIAMCTLYFLSFRKRHSRIRSGSA